MKGFTSTFKRQVPGMMEHLKSIRAHTGSIKGALEQLLFIEKKLVGTQDHSCEVGKLIKSAIDDFNVAIWIKDLQSHFIFANRACCQTILKCTLREVYEMTDADFKKDALACVCLKSDKKVMDSQTTKRFIECAQYDYEHTFLLVTKSPTFDNDKVSGTIGSAVNISDYIPNMIRQQYDKAASIEIPLKVGLDNWMIIELLNRQNL